MPSKCCTKYPLISPGLNYFSSSHFSLPFVEIELQVSTELELNIKPIKIKYCVAFTVLKVSLGVTICSLDLLKTKKKMGINGRRGI